MRQAPTVRPPASLASHTGATEQLLFEVSPKCTVCMSMALCAPSLPPPAKGSIPRSAITCRPISGPAKTGRRRASSRAARVSPNVGIFVELVMLCKGKHLGQGYRTSLSLKRLADIAVP